MLYVVFHVFFLFSPTFVLRSCFPLVFRLFSVGFRCRFRFPPAFIRTLWYATLQVYGYTLSPVGTVRRQRGFRLSGDALLWKVGREGDLTTAVCVSIMVPVFRLYVQCFVCSLSIFVLIFSSKFRRVSFERSTNFLPVCLWMFFEFLSSISLCCAVAERTVSPLLCSRPPGPWCAPSKILSSACAFVILISQVLFGFRSIFYDTLYIIYLYFFPLFSLL